MMRTLWIIFVTFLTWTVLPYCVSLARILIDKDVNRTQHRTTENQNITVWKVQTGTDLTRSTFACVSDFKEVLYQMVNGQESQQSQQFKGRVQIQRDALKWGRVQLDLIRVQAEDSGKYVCELGIYNMTEKEIVTLAQDHWDLIVSPEPEPSPGSVTTKKLPGPALVWAEDHLLIIVTVFIFLVPSLLYLCALCCQRKQWRKKIDRYYPYV